MPTGKWLYLGLHLVLSAVVLVPLVVTRIENDQARENEKLLPHVASAGRSSGRTAVVFFSLSGNTALLVIGEVSTGLFEAAGIVSNVFVWSTPKTRFSFPSHPFVQIGNASEVVAKLNDCYPSSNVSAIRDLWEEGWEVNYRAFIESILGK